VFHRLSGAWQGAPKRIRDLAEAVLSLDPDAAQAGAYIILGRLHCEAPRVPLLTRWVSREKGLGFLRQAWRAPRQPGARVLPRRSAAEVGRGAARRGACPAPALCRRAARPDFLVEDAHYAELARERLAALR